ncbi:MAG: hypothetical protein ACK4KV_19025 [Rhodocyclaceae bacterium]
MPSSEPSEYQVKYSGAMICLAELVDLLKEEGEAHAGEADGLLAYQALSRIKGNAEAWGVPLEDIGLAGYDVDALLMRPTTAA